MNRFSVGFLLRESILKPSRLNLRLQEVAEEISRESNPLHASQRTHGVDEYSALFVYTSIFLVTSVMIVTGTVRSIIAVPGNDWDLAIGFTLGWAASLTSGLRTSSRERDASVMWQNFAIYLGGWGIALFFQGQLVERFVSWQFSQILDNPVQLLNVSWPFVVGSVLGVFSLGPLDYPGGVWGLSALGSVAAITFGMPGDVTGYGLGGVAIGIVTGMSICTYPKYLGPLVVFSLLFLFLCAVAVMFTVEFLAIFLCGGLFAITLSICLGSTDRPPQLTLVTFLAIVVGLAYYVPTQRVFVLFGTTAGFVTTFHFWTYSVGKVGCSERPAQNAVTRVVIMPAATVVISVAISYGLNSANPLRFAGGFSVKRPGKDLIEICQYAVPFFSVGLLAAGCRLPLWVVESIASAYFARTRKASYFLARDIDELICVPIPFEKKNFEIAYRSQRVHAESCLRNSIQRAKNHELHYLEAYLMQLSWSVASKQLLSTRNTRQLREGLGDLVRSWDLFPERDACVKDIFVKLQSDLDSSFLRDRINSLQNSDLDAAQFLMRIDRHLSLLEKTEDCSPLSTEALQKKPLLNSEAIQKIIECLYDCQILPGRIDRLLTGIAPKLLGKVKIADTEDERIRNHLDYFNKPFPDKQRHPMLLLLQNAVAATKVRKENAALRELQGQVEAKLQ